MPPAASPADPILAEGLAINLPPLVLAAERIAHALHPGTHGRRRAGPGDAFFQYRRYQSGDAAHHIDWRASAKSTHVYVREREWEAARTLYLWCDRSASMAYASAAVGTTKAMRAQILALALAHLALRGGERVAPLPEPDMPAKPLSGRFALSRLAAHWARPLAPDAGLPAPAALPRAAEIVLIGDFMTDPADVAAAIEAFASQGIRGHLLQVLDPAEEALPFAGRIEFEEPERHTRLHIRRADRLSDAYRGELRAHRAALAEAARRCGWSFSHHVTDQAPQIALWSLYHQLTGDRRWAR